MKTTTKIIAAKKLSKLSVNKTSVAYLIIADLLELPNAKKTNLVFGNKITPVYTSGSGRFCSNQDHTISVKNLLSNLGIEFIFSNESPRGGLTGNLITVTTKIK